VDEVAELVLVGVIVVLVVGVGVLEDVVVVLVVELLVVGVLVVVVVVVDEWHCWEASDETVATPCLRFVASAGLTDDGRLLIAFVSPSTAFAAAAHRPASIAAVSWSSWLCRFPA
jgi:hypothetical protein